MNSGVRSGPLSRAVAWPAAATACGIGLGYVLSAEATALLLGALFLTAVVAILLAVAGRRPGRDGNRGG